jgi:RHS repeat-associated protein
MPTKPKAYLNYLFFDEAMKVVAEESGALQVTQANAWSDLTKPIFPINRNGFVYVYSCNNSEAIVRTDNLLVVHYTGRLLEEFHYYPFGLCFEVSKSPALEKSSEQRYNSQFIQQDEFVDGNGQTYGLEDYDFAFRNYDPQIGRWMQPDPLMQHASPYLAMSNNPVLFTDSSGLWDEKNKKYTTGDLYVDRGYRFEYSSESESWVMQEALINETKTYDFSYGYQQTNQLADDHWEKSFDADFGSNSYGRQKYMQNERASVQIQKNNGYNSSLINSGKGSDYFYKAGGILLGATGFVTQNAEMFAKVQIATEARRTGNIVNAVKKLNDLEPLGKFTRKLGYVGVAFSVAKLGNDLLSGKELKSSQILDLGINITLSVLTISNPVAIVGLGVYSVMDAYGVFDKYKEKYID